MLIFMAPNVSEIFRGFDVGARFRCCLLVHSFCITTFMLGAKNAILPGVILLLCRGVRVTVGMYQVCINWCAYCVGMHAHYVTQRYTAVCSISSEHSTHDSKQYDNVPTARA